MTVLERDPTSRAPDVETAAASAFRASAPPIMQPHMIIYLCWELLRTYLPDVYGAGVEAVHPKNESKADGGSFNYSLLSPKTGERRRYSTAPLEYRPTRPVDLVITDAFRCPT